MKRYTDVHQNALCHHDAACNSLSATTMFLLNGVARRNWKSVCELCTGKAGIEGFEILTPGICTRTWPKRLKGLL